MAGNEIRIVITATGADQAAKVIQGVANAGAQLGTVVSAGAQQAAGALGDVKSVVVEVTGLAQQAGVSTGILGSAISALTSPLGIAAGAFVGLGLAVREVTDTMVEHFQQLRSVSAVSGQSVQDTNALLNAFTLMGLSSDRLQMAMFRLGAQMEAGGEGLKLLGVNATDAAGQMREPGDVFLELADRLSKIQDPAARSAVLVSQFGRAGREMATAFEMGGLDAFIAKARELEGPTEAAYEATRKYVMAAGELHVAWMGFVETVGPPVLSWLSEVTRQATEGVKALRELFATGQAGHGSWFDRFKTGNWGVVPTTAETQAQDLAQLGVGLPVAPPAPKTGPPLPTGPLSVSSVAGQIQSQIAAAGMLTLPQVTDDIKNLDAALALQKAAFESGSIGADKYRASLAQAAAVLASIPNSGSVPTIQKQIATFNTEISKLDVAEFKGGLATRTAALKGELEQELQQIKANVAAGVITEQEGTVQSLQARVNSDAQALVIQANAFASFKGDQATRIELEKQTNAAAAKLTADATALKAAEYARDSANLKTWLTQETEDQKIALAAQLDQVKLATAQRLVSAREGTEQAHAVDVNAAHAQVAFLAEQLGTFQGDEKTRLDLVKQFNAAKLALTGAEYSDELDRAKQLTEDLKAEYSLRLAMIQHAADQQLAILSADQDAALVNLQAEIAAGILTETQGFQFREQIETQSAARRLQIETDLLDKQANELALQLANNLIDENEYFSKLEELNAKDDANQLAADKAMQAARQQALLSSLTFTGNAEEQATERYLGLIARQQQAAGDFAGFFETQLSLAFTKAGDSFDHLATLAQNMVRDLQSSLSTYFFDWLSGKFDSLKDLATNFWNSMKRSIADFLSSQAVSAIGQLLGGLIGLPGLFQSGANALNSASNTTAATFNNVLDPAIVTAANALDALGGGTGAGGASAAVQAATAAGGGGTGGGLNMPFVNPTFLQNLWTGIQNAPTNWGAGGLSGVLFGTAGAGTPLLDTTASLVDANLTVTDNLVELSNVIPDVASGLDATGSVIPGVLSGLGGMSGALAGVGAALAVFSGIMDLINGKTAAGVGTLAGVGVGAAGGAIVGSIVPGIGTVIGALFGAALGGAAGGFLGGLFGGGPSHYDLVRQQAQKQANEGLTELFTAYQTGLMSGTPQGALAALGTTTAGGKVRTELRLPEDVAASLGLQGPLDQLGHVIVQWASLTTDQFTTLLSKMQAMPGSESWVVGSGDVGYLGQSAAQQIADQAAQGAVNLLKATEEMISFTQAVGDLNTQLSSAAKTALSPEVAGMIKTGLIDPLTSGMMDLLTSGKSAAEMTTALQDFQKQAQTVAAVITFVAQMVQQFTVTGEQAANTLPADLYTAFKTNTLDPLQADMKAILQSGADPATIQSNLQKLQAQEAAVASLVGMYATIQNEIATTTGDLKTLIQETIATYSSSLQNLTDGVTRAQQALTDATTAGGTSAADEATLVKTAHDAIVARYQYELQQIQAVEQAIANLLTTFGTPITKLQIQLAAQETLTTGSTASFDAIIGAMQQLQLTTNSSALALWAFQTGMAAIGAKAEAAVTTAITPTAVTTQLINGIPVSTPTYSAKGPYPIFTPGGGGAVNTGAMGQIWSDMLASATPFLQKFGESVQTALNAGDTQGALTLLGQEATAVQALGTAAVQAVTDWANGAIAAVTAIAKSQTDTLQAQLAGINAEKQANQDKITGLNQQIDLINRAAQAQIDANNQQIEDLNEQLAVLNRWQGALQSIHDAIYQLQFSQLLPSAQLPMAQQQYQQAFAAFMAQPSSQGEQAFVSAANAYLQAAQTVYPRPAPAYQEIAATVLEQMQQVQAVVQKQVGGATIADVNTQITKLNNQVETLTNVNEDISETAAAQTKPLQDQVTALNDANAKLDAQAEILNNQITAINNSRDAQIATIQAEAKTATDAITSTITGKLADIANQEVPLFMALVGSQLTIEDAMTHGVAVQDYLAARAQDTVVALQNLETMLANYLSQPIPNLVPVPAPPAATTQPAPAGAGTSTGTGATGTNITGTPTTVGGTPILAAQYGLDYVPQTQPILVHAGEAILDPEDAAAWRRLMRSPAGASLSPGPSGAAPIVNLHIAPGSIVISGVSDPAAAAELAVKKVAESVRQGLIGKVIKDRFKL